MKGTPELGTGTIQNIFFVKDIGVLSFMSAI
jgi:hypothetical protein